MKIELKGNTLQDGTPTPDSPVDVNVVSGSNVVNIKSKNLININTLSNGYIMGTGDISTQSTNEEMYSEFIKVKPNTAYTFKIFETTWSGFNSINWIGIGEYNSIRNPIRNGFIQRDTMGIGTQNYYTITTTANTNYIIVSARGLVSATKIQLEQNSTATSYTDYSEEELPLDLGNIELCKIGDYQDYFYKSGSKWYLHKEARKIIINSFAGKSGTTSNLMYTTSAIQDIKKPASNSQKITVIASAFATSESTNTLYSNNIIGIGVNTLGTISCGFGLSSNLTTLELANEWINNNNLEICYPLENILNTEITDTTLISQLEAIYNAMSYEGQTNILQENDNLPFILSVSALQKE